MAQPATDLPAIADDDDQVTRMLYFSRNLSAQALVDFLRNRGGFDDVTATPNNDTESVVLSGPEDRVRLAATLLRRIDLAGQPQDQPEPVPLGDPPRGPDPLAPLAPPEPQTPRLPLEPRDRPDDRRFRTANFYAQNTAAQELAAVVRQVFADETRPGVVVYVNEERNGLVLTGPEPELKTAVELVQQLDRAAGEDQTGGLGRRPPAERPLDDPSPPPAPQDWQRQPQPQPAPSPAPRQPARQQAQVRLDVLLLALPASDSARQPAVLSELTGETDLVMDRIDELAAEGEAKILNQYSLTAIEGSPSIVQVGEQVRRVTGRSTRGGPGGPTPVYQSRLEKVGTLLNVVPKVGDDEQVTLSINFEKSMVTPAENGGADEDSDELSGGTITMTLQQNLRLEPGQAEALIASTGIGGERPQPVRFVLVVALRP